MDATLDLYHIFYTVAKQGNISRAANELYISQPAISKAIKRLEDSLSVPLFYRNSRGVTLTDEGALLYEQVQIAFEAIDKGEEVVKRIKQLGIGSLRIGVSTTLCKYLLLSYLKEFVEKFPHMKITIQCQSTFDTVKLLEEGKIDIGLIGKPKHLKHLVFYPIASIQDTFVTTQAYYENLKVRSGLDNMDIFKEGNIMLLNEENITRRYIEDYFKSEGIQVHQVLEVSNMDLLIEFAKIGIGIACVIKEFVRNELADGFLMELPILKAIPKREVGFAYRSTGLKTKAMKEFIAFYQRR